MSHIARCSEQDAPNLLTSDDLRSNALRRFQAELKYKTSTQRKTTRNEIKNIYGQPKPFEVTIR